MSKRLSYWSTIDLEFEKFRKLSLDVFNEPDALDSRFIDDSVTFFEKHKNDSNN